MEVPFQEQSISPFSFQGDNQFIMAMVLAIVGILTIFLLEKFSSKLTGKL